MNSEVSRIRAIGNGYYVSIGNLFRQRGDLNVGDEVQVTLTPVRESMVKVQEPVQESGEESMAADSFDVAIVAKQFRSTYPPFSRISMAEAQNRLEKWGGSNYTDEQKIQILAYMSSRKML